MTEPDKDPDPTPVIEDIKIFPSDGGVPFTFRMRLDTGCAVSLISEGVVTCQGLTVDTTSRKKIRTASGRVLDNSGTVTFGVGFRGKATEVVAAVSSLIEDEIMLSWQVLRKLGVSLNVNNHGNTKHTGNAQTPPRGDKTNFPPPRLKSYQQGHQLTGPTQTGVPGPAWTGAEKVAILRQNQLLRKSTHTTNNKQQLDISNCRNGRQPTNPDVIRRWTNLEAGMEVNIHEELRTFWRRDRKKRRATSWQCVIRYKTTY